MEHDPYREWTVAYAVLIGLTSLIDRMGALSDKEKRRAFNVLGAALYWMLDYARDRMIEEEQRK